MCPGQLESVGVRPGRIMLEAVQKMLEEFMSQELQRRGIPAKFALTEPAETNHASTEMDAQLAEAFLGRK